MCHNVPCSISTRHSSLTWRSAATAAKINRSLGIESKPDSEAILDPLFFTASPNFCLICATQDVSSDVNIIRSSRCACCHYVSAVPRKGSLPPSMSLELATNISTVRASLIFILLCLSSNMSFYTLLPRLEVAGQYSTRVRHRRGRP